MVGKQKVLKASENDMVGPQIFCFAPVTNGYVLLETTVIRNHYHVCFSNKGNNEDHVGGIFQVWCFPKFSK